MARMVSVDASADAPCIGRSVEMVSVLALPPPPPALVLPVVPPPLLLFELLQAVTESAVTATATLQAEHGCAQLVRRDRRAPGRNRGRRYSRPRQRAQSWPHT